LLSLDAMSDIPRSEWPFVTQMVTANLQETADAAMRDLLSADAVLPEQFWEAPARSSSHSGEIALMWAVFADGVDCYRRNLNATSLQGRIDFEEAEAWIFTTDWDWPFSFVNLCEVFGFNPNSVRWTLQLRRRQEERRIPRHRFRPVTRHAA
jgi:hypothetical protein